jgi:NitT/TauT family transport system ATP-binding protein
MAFLRVVDLYKEFEANRHGTPTIAVSEVAFDLKEKQFLSIIGGSGSGKTTLVKLLAGLLEPTKGHVEIRGKIVKSPPKNLTMLFQDYNRSLLPWKTISENIAFGLRNVRIDKDSKRQRVEESLSMVGLTGFTEHYPWQLSGGMQQRVALARALVQQPEILILDEPFGSLDAQTRFELEDELLRLWESLGITIVLVTHDIDEAIYLSDSVLVMGHPSQTIELRLTIPLVRPREQLHTRALPEFSGLRERIYSSMRGPNLALNM